MDEANPITALTATEADFVARLLEMGLITKVPTRTQRPPRRQPPIQIEGKPVSELIIEERR